MCVCACVPVPEGVCACECVPGCVCDVCVEREIYFKELAHVIMTIGNLKVCRQASLPKCGQNLLGDSLKHKLEG